MPPVARDEGLPDGFQGTTTTITAKRDLPGNLLTLGHQSSVRRLRLKGANQVPVDVVDGPGGNVVAVASRGQGDIVSAAIDECELINQISSVGGPDGPVGGAILAYTRNPKQGDDPPPHENAVVTLRVTESILNASPGGKAVFQ